MLISFSPDGSVEFTRNADLLALFPDDKKRIERMSEILFDDDRQQYYIEFIKGIVAGMRLRWHGLGQQKSTAMRWHNFTIEYDPTLAQMGIASREGTLYFRSYEDAVTVEVAFIDYLREQGYSFK